MPGEGRSGRGAKKRHLGPGTGRGGGGGGVFWPERQRGLGSFMLRGIYIYIYICVYICVKKR